MLSEAQRKLIRTLMGQYGEELVRGVIESVSGQQSTLGLDAGQATEVIRRLAAGKGLKLRSYTRTGRERRPRSAPKPPGTVGLITGRQRAVIEATLLELNMTDAGYKSVCERTIRKPKPVTVEDGQKLLNALAGIGAWERRKARGAVEPEETRA